MMDMYEDEEFKAYCDKEKMAVGSLYGLVAWSAWMAARKPVLIELPEQYEDKVEGVGCTISISWLDPDEVRDAIHAAGAKTK